MGGETFWIGATDMASENKFYWLFAGQDVEKSVIKMSTVGSGRCLEMRFFYI